MLVRSAKTARPIICRSYDTRVAKLIATQPASDVLSHIALDLQVKELPGEPINESLASIVLSLLKEKLPEEKVQKKLGQYPRPQNVDDLKTPRVNPLIWSQLTAQNRTHDSKAQKTQSVLVGSIAAMIKAADLALKQQQNKEIVTALTDGIALAMQSFHDMNIARRLTMKNDLHHDYAALCRSTTLESPSEYLFGDLSKLTKDIADANKLAKKSPPSSSWATAKPETTHWRTAICAVFIWAQRSLSQNKNKENIETKLNQLDTNNNVKVCTVFKAGQLAKYLPKWREITTDRTLLQYVEGKQPTQFGFRPSMFNIHERHIVEKEIHTLLGKGVIQVSLHEPGKFFPEAKK